MVSDIDDSPCILLFVGNSRKKYELLNMEPNELFKGHARQVLFLAQGTDHVVL
jgi:hypothetical protein